MRLLPVQPFGDAKITGTPTTRIKDNVTKVKSVNWKIVVIKLSKLLITQKDESI